MIGYLDVTAGASGDMLLGALVGAGADLDLVRQSIDVLGLDVRLRAETVRRGALHATRVHVELPAPDSTDRSWADVRSLLGSSALDPAVRSLSLDVFARLAYAEGRVHGVPADRVHFHEVGALDSLADVVGACAAYIDLGSPVLTSSAVAVGSGWVDTRHGRMPVPVPATLDVLREVGAPVVAGPVPHEACTPTGAALIAELASAFGTLPALELRAVGLGAGGRDPVEAPNVTRLILGTPTTSGEPGGTAPAGTTPTGTAPAGTGPVVLETNVDDQDPRLWPVVLERLFAAGANDAWLTPITMKKGRPAYTLHALCPADLLDAVSAEIFRTTTTIGVRVVPVGKRALERETRGVEVEGYRIAVKVARLDDEVVNVSVEFAEAQVAAEGLGRPLKQVLAEASALAVPGYRA